MTRVRPFDPDRCWSTYRAQWRHLRRWCEQIPASQWSAETVVEGWTVTDLVTHLGLVADSVAAGAAAGAGRAVKPMSIAEYVGGYAASGMSIDVEARRTARSETGEVRTPVEVLRMADERAAAAEAAMATLLTDAGTNRDPVVVARRGPIRLGDFLATRLVEFAVHADDLTRSLPEGPTAPVDDESMRVSVRLLAEVLAWRAPGRSVELRVPPYAAVQCVAGPSHTRGTPAATVETDAVTWMRLATGRCVWSDAVGSGTVLATGERSDLSTFLPLMS